MRGTLPVRCKLSSEGECDEFRQLCASPSAGGMPGAAPSVVLIIMDVDMSVLKPLNLMDNKGFWPEKGAIIDGVREVLAVGHCEEDLPIRDYGQYRSPQWRDEDDKLVPWQSVDWYIYDAMDEERMQVDAAELLNSLAEEPWRDERLLGDHLDLFLMEEDMFDPAVESDDIPAYSVGKCKLHSAAVISTHRIEHIWGFPYGAVKTEIMRQLCFMWGVPSSDRRDIKRGVDGTRFCINRCILREARRAPVTWETLTEDRIRRGAFCEHCMGDLREVLSSD